MEPCKEMSRLRTTFCMPVNLDAISRLQESGTGSTLQPYFYATCAPCILNSASSGCSSAFCCLLPICSLGGASRPLRTAGMA